MFCWTKQDVCKDCLNTLRFPYLWYPLMPIMNSVILIITDWACMLLIALKLLRQQTEFFLSSCSPLNFVKETFHHFYVTELFFTKEYCLWYFGELSPLYWKRWSTFSSLLEKMWLWLSYETNSCDCQCSDFEACTCHRMIIPCSVSIKYVNRWRTNHFLYFGNHFEYISCHD